MHSLRVGEQGLIPARQNSSGLCGRLGTALAMSCRRGLVRRARRLVGGGRVLAGCRVVVLTVMLRGRTMGLGGLLVMVSGFSMRLLRHLASPSCVGMENGLTSP